MKEKSDLVVELGLEELPHSFIAEAIEEFSQYFMEFLRKERIEFGKVKEYSTPRRLAIIINDVRCRQEDYREEKRGPSYDRAFSADGKPTKALLGFLKSNRIDIKNTVVKESGGGRYVFLLRKIKGKNTQRLLSAVLDKTIASMNFPKSMRWESSGLFFARPIRWVLLLFGNDTVPYRIADIESSRYTYGHRVYGNEKILLQNPSEYEQKLYDASVVADRESRRALIKDQIHEIIGKKGLQVPQEAEVLFDINTDLTELPHSVLCKFDESFLDLPPEVLTSEMIEHQYYFPLIKKKDNKLSRFFIVVSNIEDNSESVYCYQSVLHARLNDGRFFYNEDKKRDFSGYQGKLKRVTFHERLGTMYEKVERITKISEVISEILSLDKATKKRINDVASICKNDLTTLMVHEFPNLQGIMGYYYSLAYGYSHDVALGVKEHYYPRFASDILPSKIEGAVVGIADRLDTIIGIFSIGIKPKGSKDPFALRRKVLAIIRIIISLKMNFSMQSLIRRLGPLYIKNGETTHVTHDIDSFFKTRIKTIFADMGFSYDEIDASLEGVLDDIYEAYRRVQALHDVRKNRDFEDLLISFKRMGNIIRDEKDFSFKEELLQEKEEKALYRYFISIKDSISTNIEVKNYQKVYQILSTFKPSVDDFFNNVLVMDENLTLRANRLGLLNGIINVFSDVIDFSKIVSTSE